MNWDTLQQLLRILLQLASGWLLAQGYITESMVDQLIGGVISLANVVWWVVWERQRIAPPGG